MPTGRSFVHRAKDASRIPEVQSEDDEDAAVSAKGTSTHSALRGFTVTARSLVKRMSGMTANGSCMLRITWLRINFESAFRPK